MAVARRLNLLEERQQQRWARRQAARRLRLLIGVMLTANLAVLTPLIANLVDLNRQMKQAQRVLSGAQISLTQRSKIQSALQIETEAVRQYEAAWNAGVSWCALYAELGRRVPDGVVLVKTVIKRDNGRVLCEMSGLADSVAGALRFGSSISAQTKSLRLTMLDNDSAMGEGGVRFEYKGQLYQ
jgi:hypothetical protein